MVEISKSNKNIKYYICIDNDINKPNEKFLTLPDLIDMGKNLLIRVIKVL